MNTATWIENNAPALLALGTLTPRQAYRLASSFVRVAKAENYAALCRSLTKDRGAITPYLRAADRASLFARSLDSLAEIDREERDYFAREDGPRAAVELAVVGPVGRLP